jgi:uncharacterized RDD family membrane protein YckC
MFFFCVVCRKILFVCKMIKLRLFLARIIERAGVEGYCVSCLCVNIIAFFVLFYILLCSLKLFKLFPV